MDRRLVLSPESAEASEIFDKFCSANTLKGIIFHYRQLCRLLRIKPTHFPDFYPRLKEKLCSWRAQGLWTKIEKRASANCYARGKFCASSRVLIIGGGPCGLRTAIEAQLLGAKVVLIEKRDRFSRNNVLHLWPFVITDLKGLGAKKFYGKFCAGSIDHISIRQLQCLLLKVALLLGVEVHEGVGFEKLIEPTETEAWKAVTTPVDHPVSQYHFDFLIGADGRRNTLDGFRRKALRAKLAIAITANFINKKSEGEARVKEISGVSYIFNQKFFQDLNEATGIDLENIVYYKDETHYFVMTAKKHSLLSKGVLLQDHADTAKLLSAENISREKLMIYAVEAAIFSTENQLTDLEFAVNHYGQPDVAMFDFTAMYAAENASRVIQRKGQKLLMTLVGDSLLEPFWPTGSGCARGFLSSFDACWMLRSWASGNKSILEVIAERESIYRLLGQTTPENLNKEHQGYTIDPYSRYPNLNLRAVMPFQVKAFLDTDDKSLEAADEYLSLQPQRLPTKRYRESSLGGDGALEWLRSQVISSGLQVNNIYEAYLSGDVLSAIIYRFRPDLIDSPLISQENVDLLEMAASRNQVAFDLLQAEYGIQPILSGPESVQIDCLDPVTLLAYLCEIYDAFKGEIPQVKYPRADGGDESEDTSSRASHFHHQPKPLRGSSVGHKHSLSAKSGRRSSRLSSGQRSGSVETDQLLSDSSKRHRKRRSEERTSRSSLEERERRRAEIELNRVEREKRRMRTLILQRERFLRSMHLLQLSERRDDTDTYEDFTMHLYRQTAPEWEERCKRLEEKLFSSSGKEERAASGMAHCLTDVEKCVPGLARDLEQKLKGSKLERKPKDLIRAIGKIEKSDWNVQLIEKKIAESKGSGHGKKDRDDKVPKWSREAFDDKREAMKRRMEGGQKGGDENAFDETMKNLGRRLKEGNALDVGQRGSNKVSQMAGHIVDKFQQDTKDLNPTRTIVTRPLFEPKKPSCEICHFCEQRVYVVERMTAEGRFFHRNCFRCEYCNTSLRLGNYSFDRGGRYGERFYCTPHFHYISHFGWKKFDDMVKESHESLSSSPPGAEWIESREEEEVDADVGRVDEELLVEMEERGTTPERVEFENSIDLASEEEVLSEMDEDEWTDRNFGASQGDNNTSDEASELSEEEEDQITPEGNQEEGKQGRILDGGKWEEESDSDTEVASGETSEDEENDDEEDEEDECGGSTTEIETDSEFAEDPPQTVPGRVPTIIVDEPEPLLTRFLEIQPKGSPVHRPNISTKQCRVQEEPPKYQDLILEEPLPRVIPRALPRVYPIPKKWDPLPDQGKKSLELKTMYLHGPIQPPLGANPKKPTDAATQNQFSSVLDMISEQQKRLQPAPKPSPAMQAFLEGTDKLKNQISRFPQPNNQVTIMPRAAQLPPWSDKTSEIPQWTLSNNRINIEKTLEAENTVKSGEKLSPLGEKVDAEKEVSSPSKLAEKQESLETHFLTSESTTDTTILAAPMNDDSESADFSDGELTVSDLEDDFPMRPLLDPPPRLQLQDEFGTSVAVDLGDGNVGTTLPSSDSIDSLNSALFLETEISEWADRDKGNELQRERQSGELTGLDFESLDFMDGSPDDLLQSLSMRDGYSRLVEEGVPSPVTDVESWSSVTTGSSQTATPTFPASPSPPAQLNEIDEAKSGRVGMSSPLESIPLDESATKINHSQTKDLFPIYLPPEEPNEDSIQFDLLPESPTETKAGLTATSPSTARKLDQLSKERAKESELIRLLVLGRITKSRRPSPPSSSPSSSFEIKAKGNSSQEYYGSITPTTRLVRSEPLPQRPSLFKVPPLPITSITNPPTPVNPTHRLVTPPSPSSVETDVSSKGKASNFYGSLPNISFLYNGSTTPGGRPRDTKGNSFLAGTGSKKWDDYTQVSADRLQARTAARQRARMKSDAELLGITLANSPTGLDLTMSDFRHKLLQRKLSQPDGHVYNCPVGVEPFRSEPPTPLTPTGHTFMDFSSDHNSKSTASTIRYKVNRSISTGDEYRPYCKTTLSLDTKQLPPHY